MNVPLMCATLTVLLVSNGFLWLLLGMTKREISNLRVRIIKMEDWNFERIRKVEEQMIAANVAIEKIKERMSGEAKTDGNDGT